MGDDEGLAGLVSLEEFTPGEATAVVSSSFGEAGKKTKKKKKKKQATPEAYPRDLPVPDVDMSAWDPLGLDQRLVAALAMKGFASPTAIQSRCIQPAVLHYKNILAASATGTGKTLAFGIPILERILHLAEPKGDGLQALILAPTRELAIQVTDHIKALASTCGIPVAALVGGVSTEKQERVLGQKPPIVVGTPGRVWEWIQMGNSHVSALETLRFVVVDEADRMLVSGQFSELKNILQYIGQTDRSSVSYRLQSLLFSATLIQESDEKLYTMFRHISKLLGISFEGKERKKTALIDLTTPDRIAATLSEAKIECSDSEKDLYLYYFLLTNPGKTFVFINSISNLRRLLSLFRLLQLPVYGLHAQMQQRQRFKNMERIKRPGSNAILLCSDVAARGIDVPDVQHIVHFSVARDTDTYVHRSGRTARAGLDGVSVSIVSHSDADLFARLRGSLKQSVASLTPERALLAPMWEKLKAAKAVDELQNTMKRETQRSSWFEETAKAMDVCMDHEVKKTVQTSPQRRKLEAAKRHLDILLR